MEFREVLKTRRSIRKFLPRPVPDEIVSDLIDAARWAPAAGNARNLLFGVIRDNDTKEELAKASGGQEWIATAPVVIAFCTRLGEDLATVPADDFGLAVNRARFGDDLIGYLNAYPDRAGMGVFWVNAGPLIPGEHLALAAVDHGLSHCWIGHLDIPRANEILRLPAGTACLYLMPIGYAAETPAEKTARPPEECVFLDRWTA